MSILERPLLSQLDVARKVAAANGSDKPLDPSTVKRWSTRGIKTPTGTVKLKRTFVAGRVMVAADDLERFLAEVAAAKERRILGTEAALVA